MSMPTGVLNWHLPFIASAPTQVRFSALKLQMFKNLSTLGMVPALSRETPINSGDKRLMYT